jgi:excisionase family DNA binding protein
MERAKTTPRHFYTTKQIAELCGVHITTAIRWIDAGELPAYRTPGGRRRVTAEDLREFFAKHKIPADGELARPKPLILIIDDEPLVLRAAARQLKDSEYEVVTTTSGYEALLITGARLPSAIVLDLIMPGIDGFEVCSAIKRNAATAKIPILAVTGNYTDSIKNKVTGLGAVDCLPKSDAFSNLPKLLEGMVGALAKVAVRKH